MFKDHSLKEHQGTDNALDDAVVRTLTWWISLGLFPVAYFPPVSTEMDAHVHLCSKVTSRLLWPNAPAFPLPDWDPLLTPSSFLGHWVTTARCLHWQETRLDGGTWPSYLQDLACISHTVHSFSHVCIHSGLQPTLVWAPLPSTTVQVSEDTELSKAQFLP